MRLLPGELWSEGSHTTRERWCDRAGRRTSRRWSGALRAYSVEHVGQQADDEDDAGHCDHALPVPAEGPWQDDPCSSPRGDAILHASPDTVARLQFLLALQRARHRCETIEPLLASRA